MKKIILFMLVLFSFSLISCNKTIEVDSISITGEGYQDGILNMYVSDVVRLNASISPSDATDTIKWQSADKEVAPVNNAGVVTALKAGETKITVTSGKVVEEIQVIVKEYVAAESLKFEKDFMEIEPNSSKQLICNILPDNASNHKIAYSIEPQIAGVSISETGLLSVGEIDNGIEFKVKAKLEKLETSLTVLVSSGVTDIKIVDYDLVTELKALTVSLDEPYRVLHLKTTPENITLKDVKWSSSNVDVCEVNENGRLTFKTEGNAIIRMESSGFEKEVEVKVNGISNAFIEEYHIPQTYINVMKTLTVSDTNGWQNLINFRSGGTGAANSEYFVYEKYQYATSPDSYFANGGNCVDMGGLDINGLADDDIEGGLANMYLWSKIALSKNAREVRLQFSFHSKGTSKFKIRFTTIDVITKEVTHLSSWLIGSQISTDVVYGEEATVTASIPESVRGKTVILMIEYDDIDEKTDNIKNGLDAIRLKSIDLLINDGTPVDNPLWVIGDSNQSTEFTANMIANIAKQTNMTLFRDTISGSTIAPASSIGIVDHIDGDYYENYFAVFGKPKLILLSRGHNDLYWSSQPGNGLRLGDVNSTNKYETYGAIRYTLNYFTKKYPGVVLVWTNLYYTAAIDSKLRESYNQNLAIICAEYENVIYYDLYTKLGVNSENYQNLLIADGIHWNTTTQKKFTSLMVEEINLLLNDEEK